ncbi:MAG TPA: EAL domain-containing protein [Roseiarcus sp.]|nr:EAL domain-containing protein [Roseiarcus sp.]
MRKFFASLPFDKVVLGIVPLAMVAGTWFAATKTVDRLLYQDAVASGRNWTSYLVDNVRDLEAIAKGAAPSPDSRRLFDGAREDGQVFRYVIYDTRGFARFVSDDRWQDPRGGKDESASAAGLSQEDDDIVIGERDPIAARAIAEKGPLINTEDGEAPGRPAFFAEAYLPAVINGKTIGVVETYVDQTEKRDEYRGALVLMGTALLALIGIAFGIPALGLLRRSNEQRLAEAHIHFLAHHDSLTGLINRNRLSDDGAAAFAGLSRPNARLALHHVDIDHFKDINDTLGHDAGDMLIMAVAQRLKAMAKPHDLVARVGGDEFVLLQTLAADEKSIAAFAGEMRRWLSQPYDLNGHAAHVTVSIGVAVAPAHGDSIALLTKNADLALDHSKSAGRNRVSIYSNDMERELAERLRLERAIRDALAAGAFELHYQPAVEMPNARLVGFEALLRMREESAPPSIFIPIAEQMGLIDKIGEWVLREACRVAKNWPDDVKIAVNLSPAQFARAGLSSRIARILAETGLEAGRLELEITEGLLLSRSEEVMDELRRLKAEGVSIVMDDFGTGYSSLSYLWQFPFDKIKIDRAFMLGLDADDPGNAEKIVRTIIDLGRSLNVTVTVEGVENERQVAFVREARCDQVQGFYFGQPMPAWDVAAYIAKNRLGAMAASAENQLKANASAA